MRSKDDDSRVLDNSSERRYEIHVGDKLAGFVAYRPEPGAIVLVHTEVDAAFEGRGLGAVLVRRTLDETRARGLSVIAECPFVRSYLRRHPDYGDLVRPDATASG